jgi:ankyrin repeat protein
LIHIGDTEESASQVRPPWLEGLQMKPNAIPGDANRRRFCLGRWAPRKKADRLQRFHLFSDAARAGDLESTKMILELDPGFIFHKDSTGWTALHFAALSNNKEIAQLVLAAKAKVNAKAKKGETPLHVAATHLHGIDLARLLLESGANPNAKNDQGWTPLHLTALSGNSQLAELLLASNAQANLEAKNGSTPFFIALSNGQKEVMRILRIYGGCE